MWSSFETIEIVDYLIGNRLDSSKYPVPLLVFYVKHLIKETLMARNMLLTMNIALISVKEFQFLFSIYPHICIERLNRIFINFK